MRTTLDLDQDSYRLIKAMAALNHVSMGRIASEAILCRYGHEKPPKAEIGISEAGLPVLDIGRVITSEEVAAFLNNE